MQNGRIPQTYGTSSSKTMEQVKLNLGYSSMYILLQLKAKRGLHNTLQQKACFYYRNIYLLLSLLSIFSDTFKTTYR